MASEIRVNFIGDSGSLSRTMSGIQSDGKKVEGAADRMKSKMSAFGKVAAVAGAAIAIKFGKDSVKAYVEAEASQQKLSDAFDRFPKLADTNIGALRKLNTELAKKTKFDDDATASGQAVLAGFGVTGKQLEHLTPLMQDLAAKTGKDLPTAAGLMGKAFLGNTKALKALGIDYKTTGDKATDMKNIQQLLSDKVGGFAEKEGKSAAGQAEILKNQFGEVEESVGSKLVPALKNLAEVGLKVIDFIQKNSAVLKPLVTIVGTAVLVFLAVTKAIAIFNAMSVMMGSSVTIAMGPIGLIIVAVAALAAGLVYAYKHSETFRNIVQGAFKVVSDAAKSMWDLLRPVFKFLVDAWLTVAGVIVHGAADAFGWVPGIGGKLKAAADKFDEFRNSVNNSLDGIKDKTVHVTVATLTTGPLKGKPMPGNAGGTSGFAGGLSWVGERGPELVSLPSGSQVHTNRESMGMGDGGDRAPIQVNITLPDGRVLLSALLSEQKTNGGSLPMLLTGTA